MKHVLRRAARGVALILLWLAAGSAYADELGDLKALVGRQSQLIESLALRIEALEQRNTQTQAQLEEARTITEAPLAQDAVQTPPSAEGNLLAAAVTPSAQPDVKPPDDATGNLLGNVVTRGDFPRSFKIPGTDVSLQVDGYAKFDFIHDDGLVASGARLFPDTISAAGNGDRQTRFSAEQTRLALFAQAPSPHGRISGFVEADFFGTSGTARLRHAYGRLGNLLGGQTWSTLMDPYALPQSVALTAPAGSIFKRQVQIRWNRPLGENVRVAVALEQPGLDFSAPPLGRRLQRWPDFISTVRFERRGRGHVQVGGIVRRLEIEADSGQIDGQAGWGLVATGRLVTFGKDSVVLGVIRGDGVGSYLTGFATSPSAAGLTASASLDALPAFAGYVGYQHGWHAHFKSNLAFSLADLDNPAGAPASGVRRTTTAGLNLIWTPRPGFGMGLEYLYGSREDEDETLALLRRLQFAIQFGF